MTNGLPTPLGDALLESRQRWRDFVSLAADIAFETDADGRFVFVWPDAALGWPVGSLLGQSAELLLADVGAAGGFNPFRPTGQMRGRGCVRLPESGSACLAFATAPLMDPEGRVIGVRDVGQDVTEHERRDAATAAALRRGAITDQMLDCIRREVLAPRMMQTVLAELASATGSEAVAVVDVLGDSQAPAVLHAAGQVGSAMVTACLGLLGDDGDAPRAGEAADGRPMLACAARTRFGAQIGLLLARPAGARAWDADDHTLLAAATGIVRVVLEHEAIQREMARQARTDPLTGLLNRRAFAEELARRIRRLEAEGLPGALLFIDLDNFKTLNDSRGREAGDEALRAVARMLRDSTRPTDLLARRGGDEFTIWLDGADQFAAAERAEALRSAGARVLGAFGPDAPPITLSIGIAPHYPGQHEDVEALLQRADAAMYRVKRSGRGHWRVAPAAWTP